MAENEEKPKRRRKKAEAEPEQTLEEPMEAPVVAEELDAGVEEPVAEVPPVEEATEEAPTEEAPAEPEPTVAEVEPEPGLADAAAEAEAPSEREPKRKKRRVARSERRRRPKPKREAAAIRKPIVRLPKPEHERGRRQERRGVVVSSAADKTIVVKVDTIKAHPRYKKVVRRSTKFHAHDERNEAKVGDIVRIVETRPLSKAKNWRLVEIVEVAK